MTNVHTGGRWTLIAALGAAWWIEKVATVEWSYPYCSVLDDGPDAAVYGFPLPYWQPSIATSLTDFFIPWVYMVNLVAIAGCVLLLLRLPAFRSVTSDPRSRKFIFIPAAALLLVTALAFEMLVLSIGARRPTSTLLSADTHYSELRPVALRVRGRPRECTASPFWFPARDTRSTGNSKP